MERHRLCDDLIIFLNGWEDNEGDVGKILDLKK